MQKKSISLVVAVLLSQNLFAQTSELEPIIVTASNTEQSLKDVTSKVTVITGEELEERHVTTLLDALRVSNISVAQSGAIGQQSSFFLNGFSGGNTLVLIDGISYNDPTTTEGQAQLEHIMISDIDQIEIIEGAQSGVWGANAVAGVVNIVTKKATSELKTNANVEYATHNTQKYGTNISQKVDKFSYYLGVNYLSSHGISAQVPNGQNPDAYEDDGYKNRTLNAKLGYEITQNDEINFNITDIHAQAQYDPFANPDGLQNELTQDNRLYALSFNHKFSDILSSKLFYEKTEFNKEDPLGWTKKFEGDIKKYGINTQFDYISDSFLLIGVDKKSSQDVTNSQTIENKAIFATNSNRVDKLVISESIRKDWFDKFENKSTGKVGMKYNFSDELSCGVNYASAYKAPSIFQMSNAISNLVPENTISRDINVEYKSIKATYFNNKTDNLIEWIGVWPNPSGYSQVDGTSTFKGYELSFSDEVVSDLIFGLGYKKLSAKDKDGKDLIRRAKNSISASADYYGIGKTHVGVYANYVGDRDDNDNITWNPTQTGNYTLLNTVINYEINNMLKVYAKADNITDKLYQEVSGYGTYGRTFSVGLNASF